MPIITTHSPALAAARTGLHTAARSYARRYALARLLPLLAAGLLLATLALRWPAGWPLLLGLALASLAAVGWALRPLQQWSEPAAAAALDRRHPTLQDSTGLLLANENALPLLPGLQQQRVAQQLAELAATGQPLLPVSFKNAYLLSALLALAALGGWLWPKAAPAPAAPLAVRLHPDPARPAGAPAGPARLEQVQLLVTPPAYTRRAAFGPAGASFSCPAGSRVRWLVRVSGAAGAPTLELGSQRLALRPAPGQPHTYAAEQVLNASTLYRLRLAGQVSDDYAVEVRPDQAPTIRIQCPRAYTLVAARGTRPEVALQATAHDDYGLSQAELVLTVATGQGEAVKFREVRRDLSAGLAGQPTQAPLGSLLSLPRLGLHPGDELYLYLQARDNHGQSARSDTYLVQWQDTAAAASALDLGMGVNTAPAYFRSERQIIIDTEKLLAEKSKLTAAEFANRANALGFDQQALRLRYGKFLGEEAEKGMGAAAGPPTADEPALPTAEDATGPTPAPKAAAPDDHDHDHAAVGTRPNDSPTAETDALMQPYIHKHDDAETADFLEPAVKAKLQAVLDEMWAAELRLRTSQPAAARPYEYRALRLLKEVQQQTRAYVRKAGFTPPPLPEATLRLTGELKGAAAPHAQATVPAPTAQPAVRAALRWLAAVRAGQPPRPADARLLEPASAALAAVAVQQPAQYLPALRALRTLGAALRAGQPAPPAQLLAAEQGLSALLPAPVPAATPAPAPNRLARRYFQELGE
ncbi:MAG: hypothetical protein ACRYFK_06440 [Janthinobacterium lividum]